MNGSHVKWTKRLFDIFFSSVGLLLLWWLIIIAWLFASLDTMSNGFFIQDRVGRRGKIFSCIKIKTMRQTGLRNTSVTTKEDPRITKLGSVLRRTKIDELPQLWNVLIGDMSFVGPRPDVPGFADELTGKAREILELRPGITGPATLKYRDEEELLAKQNDPEQFNREVIFPDKVRINLQYMENWSMSNDLRYIWQTIFN